MKIIESYIRPQSHYVYNNINSRCTYSPCYSASVEGMAAGGCVVYRHPAPTRWLSASCLDVAVLPPLLWLFCLKNWGSSYSRCMTSNVFVLGFDEEQGISWDLFYDCQDPVVEVISMWIMWQLFPSIMAAMCYLYSWTFIHDSQLPPKSSR